MNNFKALKIWQKGLFIATKTYQFTSTFPKEEKYGLAAQLNKAAVSISSNIAEGCSRRSDNDYYRFLEISLGSAFETETQLLIAQAVNFGDALLRTELLEHIDQEQKMIIAYMKTLSG